MHELCYLRIKAYEILKVLFEEKLESIREFFDHKDAI